MKGRASDLSWRLGVPEPQRGLGGSCPAPAGASEQLGTRGTVNYMDTWPGFPHWVWDWRGQCGAAQAVVWVLKPGGAVGAWPSPLPTDPPAGPGSPSAVGTRGGGPGPGGAGQVEGGPWTCCL